MTPETLGDFTLHPREERIIVMAVPARRLEFTLGRAACRLALERAGCENPPPVLKGKRNEPLWPEGYTGAISHAAGCAVSAACPSSKLRGIGIDIISLDEETGPELYDMVCTSEERRWVEKGLDAAEQAIRFKKIFSAKEAAFKAFFPLAGEYIDFRDASITWDENNSSFRGLLLRTAGDCPAGAVFSVEVMTSGGFLVSSMLLL